MRYAILLAAATLISTATFAQTKKMTESQIFNKWLHATVNFQLISSDEKQIIDLRQDLENKKITQIEFQDSFLRILQNRRAFGGTGVYLLYHGNHYLLTVKHALIDRTALDDHRIADRIQLVVGDKQNGTNVNIETDGALNGYGRISEGMPLYIFSTDVDLAIVALDGDLMGENFYRTLDARGFIPIQISDIDVNQQYSKGQFFWAFGYPSEPSKWDVSIIHDGRTIPLRGSIPVISRGVITEVLSNKGVFYCDGYVDHGNSGGPMVIDGKLVGLCNGFETEAAGTDSSDKLIYRRLYLEFTMSSFILPLLKQLEGNMDARERALNGKSNYIKSDR